jgi:trimeric autotransporter adhesin
VGIDPRRFLDFVAAQRVAWLPGLAAAPPASRAPPSNGGGSGSPPKQPLVSQPSHGRAVTRRARSGNLGRMARRAPVFASSRIAVLGSALSVMSCGLLASFDEYRTQRVFAVAGTVAELEGARVTLLLNGGAPLDVGDGPFSFPAVVADGTGWSVTVREQPARHRCTVTPEFGTMTGGDVTDVVVRCPANDPTLALLGVALDKPAPWTAALSPTFAPTTMDYRTEPLLVPLLAPHPEVTVTATGAHAGSTITLASAPPTLGIAGLSFPAAVGAQRFEISSRAADGTSATYTLTVDGVVNHYFKAAYPRISETFGGSIALDGDTLVVSAVGDRSAAKGVGGAPTDGSALQSGAVHVFRRTGGHWSLEAYIKPSNTRAGMEFGSSVALSGDTLAVGAHYETSNAKGVDGDQTNTSAGGAGAVYVFRRGLRGWAQEAYVKASNSGPNANFGSALVIREATMAVGAPGESSNGTSATDTSAYFAGAVYVFTRTGATWAEQAYLKASNIRAGARFGFALALTGETLAVGAPNESSSATGVNGNQSSTTAPSAGAVYVFTRASASWSQQAYVKASNTRAGARFGDAVALAGDTLVVGSPGESSAAKGIGGQQADTSATDAGAAYAFARVGLTWSQAAYLKASNTAARGAFGASLALVGGTLAVGGPGDRSGAVGVNGDDADTRAEGSGAAFVFQQDGSTWRQRSYVKASNTRTYARFGSSVALTPDGLAVGSAGESGGAAGIDGNQEDPAELPKAGAAYVY